MKWTCAKCGAEAETEGEAEKPPEGWHLWNGGCRFAACSKEHFLEILTKAGQVEARFPSFGLGCAEIVGGHEYGCARFRAYWDSSEKVYKGAAGEIKDEVARTAVAHMAGLGAAWRAHCDCERQSVMVRGDVDDKAKAMIAWFKGIAASVVELASRIEEDPSSNVLLEFDPVMAENLIKLALGYVAPFEDEQILALVRAHLSTRPRPVRPQTVGNA